MVSDNNLLQIEVVYALPHTQIIKEVIVPGGCTVGKAIQLSGIINQFPDIDLTKNKCGIFGKSVHFDTPLQSRDRIEIYRALIINPKDARRIRARNNMHA